MPFESLLVESSCVFAHSYVALGLGFVVMPNRGKPNNQDDVALTKLENTRHFRAFNNNYSVQLQRHDFFRKREP
jgi:hypothetical protein